MIARKLAVTFFSDCFPLTQTGTAFEKETGWATVRLGKQRKRMQVKNNNFFM
jgi:hypothetical protein